MKCLLIYAHPWDGSYNHAILDNLINGLKNNNHQVDIFDLNKDNFNPVFKDSEMALYSKGKYTDKLVGDYQERIKNAEYIFFIFPIWWGSMPAILKGFIEKVFLPEVFYTKSKSGLTKGLITNIKGVTIINTMGGPKLFYNFYLKNPIKQILIKDTLKLCGLKKIKLIQIGRIRDIANNKRKKWLKYFENYSKKISK